MAGLTVDRVNKLKAPGRYGDGGGLYLNIAPAGTKSWVQRIMIDGKRLDKGLGGFPSVSLSTARKIADSNRVKVKSGENPWAIAGRVNGAAAQPAVRSVPTFEQAARRFYEASLPTWRSAKHAAVWVQSLELHVFPAIGSIPVDELTRADVLGVLTPLWAIIPETARRIRRRVRAVLRWALAFGFVEHNAAGELIDGALPTMPPSDTHHRALHYSAVPDAYGKLIRWRAFREPQPHPMTVLALRFVILTAARSGEVRGATWDEIEEYPGGPWSGGLWTIPAARMKTKKLHRVPLSPQAMDVLQSVSERISGPRSDNGLVFPGGTGRPIGESVLFTRCQVDALGCSPHGFRSSFRDWAAERSGASREAIELALSHAPGGRVEMAYFRSDLLDQRRELMNSWGDFVDWGHRALF